MTLVIDTSILIDVLRNFPRAVEFVTRLDDVAMCSEITRAEVLRGIRSQQRVHTEELFSEFLWVGIGEHIARRAGDLGRQWRRTHPGIGIADYVVAATAQHLGLPLATRNVKHFPMFKGLRPPYRA